MPRSHSQASRGRSLTIVAIPSSAGNFIAHFSDAGLAQLDFPADGSFGLDIGHVGARAEIEPWISSAAGVIEAILSGKAPPEFPPLDLRSGTAFQQRVWLALGRIGLGETKTYAEIARELGSPGATRAVGSACGANPIPLLIPCHRVVASHGKLGGFSGGLHWKKRLLAIEGIRIREGELALG